MLGSYPWANVSEGSRRLGITPLAKIPMSEGTHVLVLENPEQHLRTTITVVIRSGENTVRNVALAPDIQTARE